MTLVSIHENNSDFFHAIAGDEARGAPGKVSYGNDVGDHTQPASGVVGTSSACYPSHRAAFKFS
jgi:hypothetical protein